MPLLVTIYLLVYAAMVAASLAYALHLDGYSKAYVIGDLLAATGMIILAVAYWIPTVREALGVSGAVLFVVCLGWSFVALEPMVRLMMRNEPQLAGGNHAGIYVAVLGSFAFGAPVIWWGLRVCLGAINL
jgi:hypothetical protein